MTENVRNASRRWASPWAIAVGTVVFAWLTLAAFAWAEMRDWTDSTGKHKIRGEFAGLDGTKVRLKKPDGKFVSIELEKLSGADRKLARNLAQNGGGEEADPFTPVDGGSGSSSAGKAPAKPKHNGLVVVGERIKTKVKRLMLISPEEWQYKPGKPREKAEEVAYPKATMLQYPTDDDDRYSRSRSLEHAKFLWRRSEVLVPAENYEDRGKVYRFDLRDGKCKGIVENLKGWRFGAASEDGRFVVMTADSSNDAGGMGRVYSLEGDKPKLRYMWRILPRNAWSALNDSSAMVFVSDDTVVVFSHEHRAIGVWRLSETDATPLYVMAFASDNYKKSQLRCKALPDGEHFAMIGEGSLYVVKIEDGAVLGRVSGEFDDKAQTAVSPDGQKIAVATSSRFYVFDLTNGETMVEEIGPYLGRDKPVSWFNNECLLVSGEYLIDVRTGVVVSKVDTSESSGMTPFVNDGRLWYAARFGSSDIAICNANANPRKLADLVSSYYVDDSQFITRAGSSVALVVEAPPEIQGEIVEQLRGRMKKMKLQVADSADLAFIATFTVKPPKEYRYRIIPMRRTILGAVPLVDVDSIPVQTTKYAPIETTLRLMEGRTKQWENTDSGEHPYISPIFESGETVEGELKAFAERRKNWFTHIHIPPKVFRYPQGKTYLSTMKLSADGLTMTDE